MNQNEIMKEKNEGRKRSQNKEGEKKNLRLLRNSHLSTCHFFKLPRYSQLTTHSHLPSLGHLLEVMMCLLPLPNLVLALFPIIEKHLLFQQRRSTTWKCGKYPYTSLGHKASTLHMFSFFHKVSSNNSWLSLCPNPYLKVSLEIPNLQTYL